MQTLEADKDFIAQLFGEQPEAVIWYTPILSSEGSRSRVVTDFELRYCNDEVSKILGVAKELLAGQTILTTSLMDEASKIATFNQFLHVWSTGERQVISYYHAGLNRHLEAVRSKVKDGIISITRDRTKEVRAEQKLLEKEKQYQDVINTAKDGVLVLKPVKDEQENISDFIFSFCNNYAILEGNIPTDCIGKSLLAVFPHLKDSRQFELHKQVMITGEPMRFETSFRTPEGKEYGWFIVSLTRIEDAVVSRFIDITINKQKEQQIAEQRDLLQGILDASLSAVFTCDAIRDNTGVIVDMLIKKINKTFTQINGKSAEEVEGKSFLTVFPAAKKAGAFDYYCNVIETGEKLQTEMYYNGEGIDGWFEVAAVKYGADGIVVSFTDVTDEKKYKQELARTADYMQQMIDIAPTGIFTMTPVRNHNGEIIDFSFTRVNRTLSAYTGQHPDALIGRLHDDWFPGYKTNGTFEIYKQIAETGEEIRFERHYNDDNVDVWLDVTAKGVSGDVMVSFHDYTPLKKLQLQLETTIKELRRSNQNLEEFAYAASHDLQAPLRKIYTFSDRLRRELSTHLTEGQLSMFRRIERATESMRTLIEDLLSYSEVGGKVNVTEPVNLNAVVEQVIQDLESVIQDAGAVIQKESLPELKGDERQLRQLFQNLISNAIKYRRPGVPPKVSVHCKVVASTDPVMRAFKEKQKDNYYLIEVADNGIGFEQEHAEKIFQVFQRLHGREEYEGTGVGLAIATKVVTNHKGYITAEGNPGAGATFRVLLPV